MPVLIKDNGALKDVSKENFRLRHSGSVVVPTKGLLRHNGQWVSLWIENTTEPEDPVSNSPLPAGVPRWGVAQFADTDFTGGKTDPNADGQPYQRWTGPQDFIDSMLQTYDPSMEVSMNIPFPDYGYFAHKASDGTATFLDGTYGWPGGWDGATWEDGGFGSTQGPISVMYDDGSGPAEWLIYRTDFSGVGDMMWNVTVS